MRKWSYGKQDKMNLDLWPREKSIQNNERLGSVFVTTCSVENSPTFMKSSKFSLIAGKTYLECHQLLINADRRCIHANFEFQSTILWKKLLRNLLWFDVILVILTSQTKGCVTFVLFSVTSQLAAADFLTVTVSQLKEENNNPRQLCFASDIFLNKKAMWFKYKRYGIFFSFQD